MKAKYFYNETKSHSRRDELIGGEIFITGTQDFLSQRPSQAFSLALCREYLYSRLVFCFI